MSVSALPTLAFDSMTSADNHFFSTSPRNSVSSVSLKPDKNAGADNKAAAITGSAACCFKKASLSSLQSGDLLRTCA